MDTSFNSDEAARFMVCGVSIKVLHMFASVLNLFPLLVSISLWPRVMNPKNPPWITGHLAACAVYALLRLVALIASIYAIIRMKRPSFVKAYIACTWLGVFLDGIGIVISLTIIEYPFSTITTGFMSAYSDRYTVKHVGYVNLCAVYGIYSLIFYLVQLVMDLSAIFIAKKAAEFIAKKPILVYPGDEGVQMQPLEREALV